MDDIHQSSRIGFLHLPPELRNRIYGSVFIENHPIDMNSWAQASTEPVLADRLGELMITFSSEPSLLRTCRELRKEALPIFYGQNIFDSPVCLADDCWELRLAKLEPHKAKMVRCIRFKSYWSDMPYSVEFALGLQRSVTSLESAHQWTTQKRIPLNEGALFVEVEVLGRFFWTNRPEKLLLCMGKGGRELPAEEFGDCGKS